MNAYLATILISTIPNLVLFLIPDWLLKTPNGTRYLLCFASGALLGDVFLHSLPHLMMPIHGDTTHGDEHDRGMHIGGAVLAGLMLFFLTERLLSLYVMSDTQDDHKDDDKKPIDHSHQHLSPMGWLNLAADALHNFTDGIALGVACRAGKSLGFATMLSVFFHEIPHEFADFTILVSSGMSKIGAIRLQFVTAVAALVGTWVGSAISENNKFAEDMLVAATSGGFVYLATVGSLASVVHSKRKATLSQTLIELGLMSLGVGLMIVVALSEEHDHGDDFPTSHVSHRSVMETQHNHDHHHGHHHH